MDIRSCRNCGKIFTFRGAYNCPDCIKEIDALFVSVRDFIYQNPGASVEDICKETGASMEMVMDWLREGRLMTNEHSVRLLKCSKCGASIASGKLCAKCANDFMSQVSNVSQEMDAVLRRQAEASERRGLNLGNK